MVVDVRLQLGWGEEAFPLNHLVRARTLSIDILKAPYLTGNMKAASPP